MSHDKKQVPRFEPVCTAPPTDSANASDDKTIADCKARFDIRSQDVFGFRAPYIGDHTFPR